MNIQKVKQGGKITRYVGYYMIILGILFVVFQSRIMKMNFNSTNQLWGFFTKYNPDIAHIFFLYSILIGIIMISSGIVIIFLSDYIIKRKDKMTWVTLFIIGILNWAVLLTVSILLKNWIMIALTFVGWLVFIIGMLLPIRYYLEKSYKEY